MVSDGYMVMGSLGVRGLPPLSCHHGNGVRAGGPMLAMLDKKPLTRTTSQSRQAKVIRKKTRIFM